jgi:flagellar biosynthesis protein FliR
MSERAPRWQQSLGIALLVSVAVIPLINGLRGNSFELYRHFGGGVSVLPWQQIAFGILMLGFTIWLVVQEMRSGNRQGKREIASE